MEERTLDLSRRDAREKAMDGTRPVHNLAADMGGVGFIENNQALCVLSVLVNTEWVLEEMKYGHAST